jgi:hypothetical protein
MANLHGHEAGNGGHSQGEPTGTAPVLDPTTLYLDSVLDIHLPTDDAAETPLSAGLLNGRATGVGEAPRMITEPQGSR